MIQEVNQLVADRNFRNAVILDAADPRGRHGATWRHNRAEWRTRAADHPLIRLWLSVA
jgi:hypothetical protein